MQSLPPGLLRGMESSLKRVDESEIFTFSAHEVLGGTLMACGVFSLGKGGGCVCVCFFIMLRMERVGCGF